MIQKEAEPVQARAVKNSQEPLPDDSDFARPPDRMTWLSLALPPVHSGITAVFAEAIAEAAKLPVEDQNFLAWRIMEEIAEEKKWTDSVERNIEVFDRLAAQARQEVAQGKAQPLESVL